MTEHLGKLVMWLPPETIKATMPGKLWSSSQTLLVAQKSSYRDQNGTGLNHKNSLHTYKSHNTVKFIVAVAPHGYIMYISPVYGGQEMK